MFSTNSVPPDETAQNEPSHQDLHCLPFRFDFLLRPLFEKYLRLMYVFARSDQDLLHLEILISGQVQKNVNDSNTSGPILTAAVRAFLGSHVGMPNSAYGWSGGFSLGSPVFAHL